MMRYRHKKRGGVYEVLYHATLQMSSDRAHDDQVVVVYQSVDDHKVYVRPYTEFYDGRFEEMS